MGEKLFNFNINSLAIFAIFPKIQGNALSHDNYQKLFIGISISYIYQSIPFSMQMKNNVFPCLVPEIFLLQTFFFQKILICNFCSSQHCASCDIHQKALEEQISNIYTFMGEKRFNFDVNNFIIFAILPKIYLNALLHDNY